jgi:CheY-like chemotaxis protein
MTPDARPLRVLLVEDDPGDVLLVREAFADSTMVTVALEVASDGVEALALLRQAGDHAGTPTPDLILLDLNLPRMDGREVIAEIKDDPKLRVIPIVVLTTSEAEEDVMGSYALHANAYVTKPAEFDRFVEVVRQIERFFGSVVRLTDPPTEDTARAS